MNQLPVVDRLSPRDFVENHIRRNQPVVVTGNAFDASKWMPESLRDMLGDLPVQVYDTLFALQEVSTLRGYLDEHFDRGGGVCGKVPYVRWYNKLKDVALPWGDEALRRMSGFWRAPAFLPDTGLLVPMTSESKSPDPVHDCFPYRGILVAATGARTRLHRDPFCSDAIVSQFYGVKEFVMYDPRRTAELTFNRADATSFGGFVDVRRKGLATVDPEPDYYGLVAPGDAVYVPHGWLHDALVVEDSVSVTWNFVHEQGALEFIDYLMSGPETDSEFEVLKYFHRLGGEPVSSANDILQKFARRFSDIEAALA